MKNRIAFAVLAAGLLAVPAMAQGPYKYHAVTPCRVLDTRACVTPGVPYACNTGPSSGVKNYALQGKCNVPQGAGAVTINATAVSPTGAGFLTLWPAGGSEPLVSTLNFTSGDSAIANGAIVPLATIVNLGDNDLSARLAVAPGTMHLVVDITGYFSTN